MIIDKLLQVSSAQALTGTDPVPSTDVIDFGSDRDVGPGSPLWLVVVARVGLGGTGGPTIKFDIETDDNSGFSSATKIFSSQALAATAFASGKIFAIPMPMANERFLRLVATMTGTSPTATIDAFLTNQPPTTWQSMPDAL